MGKIPALCLALGLAAPARILAASDPVPSGGAVDPALFSDLRWRSIGPFRGGRVLAVAGVPGEPTHFYFGGVNGGVWETHDAGRTWRPIFDAQPIGSIGALAVAPSNPKVIYVGTGEADMRSDIAQGDGMYKSTDGGKTWTHVGLADSQQIGRILVDPRDADRVYVAALGHPYGPERRARRLPLATTAAGSGRRCSAATTNTGADRPRLRAGRSASRLRGALADAPAAVERLSAVERARQRPATSRPTAATPGRPIRRRGFPARPGRIGLAVAPSRPAARLRHRRRRARAGSTARTTAARAGRARAATRGSGGAAGTSAASRSSRENADVVYVVQHHRLPLARTAADLRAGQGRARRRRLPHALDRSASTPSAASSASTRARSCLVNGGETWSSWYNQPTGQFYHVVTDNRFPYWVYGSQQDSGAAGVPSRTTDRDGINLTHFRDDRGRRRERQRSLPTRKTRTSSSAAASRRLDLRTGQTRSLDPTLAYPGRHRARLDAAARLLAARPACPLLRQPAALPHRGRRRAAGR